jgi:hypothetical protein
MSHSLVEQRGDNFDFFGKNLLPSTCHSVTSTQKVQINFFFVPIDVPTHTWADTIDGIEKK